MTNNVLLKRQLRSDNFRILTDDGVPEIVAGKKGVKICNFNVDEVLSEFLVLLGRQPLEKS